MCGITGIIQKSTKRIDKKLVEQMNTLIKHRGPDDEGFFYDKNIAFGHRRLSIIDLSNHGHQPMTYMKRFTITYNGEVYNYLELKKELEKHGHTFNSHSDTEVILAAYAQWGPKCVEHFNGMWAFAIYDPKEQTIFCSRDRFGIKPFYYTENTNYFAFASEIKQLLKLHPKNKVNHETLNNFLIANFSDIDETTFFKDIYKLNPGHNLFWDLKTHKKTISPYYTIKQNPEIAQLPEQEAIELYFAKLNNAIELRLRSDVKVGTCLSGGLDSSTVATLASQKYSQNNTARFTAITASSIDPNVDETKFAQAVAEKANLDWHPIKPTTEDFINNMDDVIYAQEEPFGSPSIFMQFFVMQQAKNINCKVMLDGQGGDETLLGYERYYPSAYINMFKRHGLIQAIKTMLDSSKNNEKMGLKWISLYLFGTTLPSLRKHHNKNKCSFLKNPSESKFIFLNKLAKSYFNVFKLQEYEINTTNLPALLRFEDKNSMYHSIEARLPMIDYNVVEAALNIDVQHKIKNGWTKYLLRQGMNNKLPEKITWRKDKLGFNAPESVWLNAYQKSMKKQITSSKILNEITHMKQLMNSYEKLNPKLQWRLFNIASWEKNYNVHN